MQSRKSYSVAVLALLLLAATATAQPAVTKCQTDQHCYLDEYCDNDQQTCAPCTSEANEQQRCIQMQWRKARRSLQSSAAGATFQNAQGRTVSCSDTTNGGMAGCATCVYYQYYKYFQCKSAAPGYFLNGAKTYSCSDPDYGEVGCATCTTTVSGGYYSLVCQQAAPGYFLFQNRIISCGDTENGGIANCKTCTLSSSATVLQTKTPSGQYGVYGIAIKCTASDYRGNFINSNGLPVSCRNSQQGGIDGCIQCTQTAPGAPPTCTATADGYYLNGNTVQSCTNTALGGQVGCGKCTFSNNKITCTAAAVGYFFKNGQVVACSNTALGGVRGCTNCALVGSSVSCFSTSLLAISNAEVEGVTVHRKSAHHKASGKHAN